MVEKRYIEFIEKLIMQTKSRKVEWNYLESNRSLCYHMNWIVNTGNSLLSTVSMAFSGNGEDSFKFNEESSFYSKIQENYIVLYVVDSSPAELYVIPPTFKRIVRLMPDEYGDHITRLLNIVLNQFPSGDAFINDFLFKMGD